MATMIITIAFLAGGTYRSKMFLRMKPIFAPAAYSRKSQVSSVMLNEHSSTQIM